MALIEDRDTNSNKQSDLSEQVKTESSPTRKPWLWWLLAILLVSGGVVLWRSLYPSSQPTQSAVAQPQGKQPKAIETVALSKGEATRQIQLLGQVESREQATIRTQTAGIVQQILVEPGDRVTRGATIAILDDSDQQLAVAEAKARLAEERSNLARLEVGTRPEIIAQRQAAVRSTSAREEEAQDNLDRLRNLVKEGAFSQRSLIEAQTAVDDAQGARLEAEATLAEAVAGPIQEEIAAQQANVQTAVAALNQAELSLQRTRVQALTSGVVQERQVSPGDYAESAGAIATLVAGDSLDVFLEIPEELSGTVRPGSSVELTARALPQWKERATITGVVPTANATSRRQRVRVRLDNPPSGLLSGMAITGTLTTRSDRPSFVVSRDALTRKQDRWYVFAVNDGKAEQVEVELVSDIGKEVAIYNDRLRAGQPVVLRGGDGLEDGAAVKVTNSGTRL
jgi:multidrug efflux pump subunit AcrA (membrane-fusion protein)